MSAANVVITRDAVHLFTDSAACDGLGRVERLVSKVRTLPGGRCAIAIRGPLGALDALAEILPTLGRDVDQLRAVAADGRLRVALSRWRQALRGRFALTFDYDVTVVGWGEHGPAAFLFSSHRKMRRDDGSSVAQTFEPFDITRGNVMPAIRLPEGAERDPLAAMPEIMRRQRDHREPSILLPKGRRFVGGFVEQTTVTRDGAVTRRVGGWHEPVGQVIGGGNPEREIRRRVATFLAKAFAVGFAAGSVVSVAWQLAHAGAP